jgi:hypothetical protein
MVLDLRLNWLPFKDEEIINVLSNLAGWPPGHAETSTLAKARCANLSFYDRHRLIELQFCRDAGREYVFGLDGPDQILWLDGESSAIHETNEAESLELVDETVLDYLRFFLFFVRGEAGPFVLIESPDQIDVIGDLASGEDDAGRSGADVVDLRALLGQLRSRAVPLTIGTADDTGRWLIDCSVVYDGHFVSATLDVSPDGALEMVDSDPIAELTGMSTPRYPPLTRTSDAFSPQPARAAAEYGDSTAPLPAPSANGDHRADRRPCG